MLSVYTRAREVRTLSQQSARHLPIAGKISPALLRRGVNTRLEPVGAGIRSIIDLTLLMALQNDTGMAATLQAYLGHRNIAHTVRYIELAPTRFKDFWRD